MILSLKNEDSLRNQLTVAVPDISSGGQYLVSLSSFDFQTGKDDERNGIVNLISGESSVHLVHTCRQGKGDCSDWPISFDRSHWPPMRTGINTLTVLVSAFRGWISLSYVRNTN